MRRLIILIMGLYREVTNMVTEVYNKTPDIFCQGLGIFLLTRTGKHRPEILSEYITRSAGER